jgi:mono/diheme cytochrome c family protein
VPPRFDISRKVDAKMTSKIVKLVITLVAVPVFAAIILTSTSVRTSAAGDEFDAAAFYKTKCAMCHGAKAEKKFDTAKPDDKLVEAIIKGVDGTPKMPSYEDKGVNTDQAKALVAFMKSLKQ